MELKELLLELGRVEKIPVYSDNRISIAGANNALKNTNLSNIEISQNQLPKAYPIKSNKEIISTNKPLKISCKYHKDQDIGPVSIEKLNNMIDNFNSHSQKGRMNPCDIGNRYNKNRKLDSSSVKSDATASDEDNDYEDRRYGSFDSKEEAFFYRVLRSYISKQSLTKGWTILPKDGYGNKFKFVEPEVGLDGKKQHRDADVYLQFPPKVKKIMNGIEGVAFLIDGLTHYSPLASNAEFTNDTARNESNKCFVKRINVYDINDNKTGNLEKQNIKKYIHEIVDSLIKIIPHNTNKLGKTTVTDPKKLVRSAGETKIGKSLQRENKKRLYAGKLTDLINHLRSRSNSALFGDSGRNDDEYESDKYGYERLNRKDGKRHKIYKLSSFLDPDPQSPNKFTGKMSYEKYKPLWNQIFSMAPDELAIWKEKHQAKNGEKLFSKDTDGNIKLFENKN